MLGPVPVVIGVAWGTIIYSVRAFSDSTNLPVWARPVLDGLLAINLDLSMDAVAIRLGMWDWGNGLDFQYFGVPYNNFWAWFWVVFSFSLSLRLLSKLPGFWGRWLSPAGAIILRHCRRPHYQPYHYQHSQWPDPLCCHHCSPGRRSATGIGTSPGSIDPVQGCIYLSCAYRISCLFPDSRISLRRHPGPTFLAGGKRSYEYDRTCASSRSSESLVSVQ